MKWFLQCKLFQDCSLLWGLVVLCSEDDPSHAGVTAPVSAELTNPLEKASVSNRKQQQQTNSL